MIILYWPSPKDGLKPMEIFVQDDNILSHDLEKINKDLKSNFPKWSVLSKKRKLKLLEVVGITGYRIS